MKIEVTDNYVLVNGMFYYRKQEDACAEQENVCYPKKREDGRYYDCSKCGGWLPQPSDSAIKPRYCMWCGTKVIY